MMFLYINQLNIKKIFLLFVITTLSLFTFMSQTVSSQENSSSSFNITGAPETGVDNLESEKTASSYAQEIAFNYLKCFIQKSSAVKDPLEIVAGDLVSCITSTNNDLSLSFYNDVSESTVAENAVFCNNLPVFTSTTQTPSQSTTDTTTTPAEENTEETQTQSTTTSTTAQRNSEQNEVDSTDFISQLNTLVANPLFETGYQKLHICLGVEVDSIGFVTIAESRTPEERVISGTGSSTTTTSGTNNDNEGDDNGDPTPDNRDFGFGVYNQDGNNYDIIIRSETECLNYFSIAGEVTPEIEAFCSENIVKDADGNFLIPANTSNDDNNDDNNDDPAPDPEEEDAKNNVLDKLGFSRGQEVTFNKTVDNLKISIATGLIFCGAIIGVENIFNISTGLLAVASSDSANRIYPCIVNPLTEAVREQLIKNVFQEYINYANSGFDGASLRFDNFADFTNAALQDTADAYLGTISHSVFGGCGINFPGLYIVLSAPEVNVARPNCSAFDFEQNTYANRERTVDEWLDQIENPGKYSLGIQIDFFEDLKEEAVKKSTSFIDSTEKSGRIPKSKDKDCVKRLIRERKVQITNNATLVDNNREYLDDDKAEEVEVDFRTKGDGAIISIAEAKAKCGIDTNSDELKRLEETAESASFDELLSKDELRDLLGKAIGATIVGQIRRHARDLAGEGDDDSGDGDGGGPYSYVGPSSAERILNAYNSSLKALWQQNLDASEFTTLINFLELQENITRFFQSYFVTLDTRVCISPGLLADGLTDPIGYGTTKRVTNKITCKKGVTYSSGDKCFGQPIGSTFKTTIVEEDKSKPIYGKEATTKVLKQASSYVFRKDIDDQYFDSLTRWCFKNQTVTKDISNNSFGARSKNKIKFEDKDLSLKPLLSSVNGDFDISQGTLVGKTAHDTRAAHYTISENFSLFSSLLTDDESLSGSQKTDYLGSLASDIFKTNAKLVLTLKESPISLINQALEDTFDILKHQRTAAQQFGASIEFREWLRNKDGVKKTRVFVSQNSLYGATRNERFFSDDRFIPSSGAIDNTFNSGDNIDTLADYSDDKEFCSFYEDSAIDINANDLVTGQTTGTEVYIPTDCAVGHIVNWVKTEGSAEDIVNFNTYMANIVPKLFAVYTDAILNSYTYKSQNDLVREKGEFPSEGVSNSYGNYYSEGGYNRDHSFILKQFTDDSDLLGIYVNLSTTDGEYENIYTKEKLDNLQKALSNRIKTILNQSVIDSF